MCTYSVVYQIGTKYTLSPAWGLVARFTVMGNLRALERRTGKYRSCAFFMPWIIWDLKTQTQPNPGPIGKKIVFNMKNKKNNEELQSRREFFKKAAKGALPIIAATVLASAPAIVKAAEPASGCQWGCQGSCYGNCNNSCRGYCAQGCTGTCVGSCKGTCQSQCNAGSGWRW